MKTRLLWSSNILCLFLYFSCTNMEKEVEIENMYTSMVISEKWNLKKSGKQTNHFKNLEMEMLDEVFCYAPSLGRGAFFFIPTSRMQNFEFINIQPSDVVIGGGGGTPSDLNFAQMEGSVPMVSIKDVNNPCLKSTLDMVLHNTDILNQMSQMLRNFGQNTNIKIVFEEKSFPPDNHKLGEFRAGQKENFFRIALDINKLPSYSKEVIVSVIYHEMLHAQLEYLFHQKAMPDHERMASEYLFIAVNSMRNQFQGMDEFTAKSLIFAGLKNTLIYQTDSENMNKQVRENMYEIESNYKNRKNGTYCN